MKSRFWGLVLLAGLVVTTPLYASTIAYDVPAGQTGNQNYTGSLGLDFDVLAPIYVTSLGVFDNNGDGIAGNLSVKIYKMGGIPSAVTPTLTFTGAGDTLINGSRFRDLLSPVMLGVGHYSVVSWGYGNNNLDGNSGCVGLPASSCFPNNPFTLSTMNDAGGVIDFVGSGRYGQPAGAFPTTIDSGPENRYHAGTFTYQPVPEPATLGLMGLGIASLLRRRFRK